MTTTDDTPATTSPEDTGTSPRHPLDPLTGTEIEAATSILKRDRHLKVGSPEPSGLRTSSKVHPKGLGVNRRQEKELHA